MNVRVKKSRRTVLLYSGGLDSTTLLYQLLAEGMDPEVMILTVLYGSLHNDKEFHMGKEIINSLIRQGHAIQYTHVILPKILFQGSGSALMDEREMPTTESEGPSATVVPFRNGVMLSMAAALANSNGYDFVAIAAHKNDAEGWAYPDTTVQFLEPMGEAIWAGTYPNHVKLYTPFRDKTKAEVVKIGHELGVPFRKTWSCYRGGEIHCGECPTCQLRKRAFREAGINDPTTYRNTKISF